MLSNLFDIIIVGGGLAGSVLTNRLHASNPGLKILLLEAGRDIRNDTLIPYFANQSKLIGSYLDWNYTTVPQTHLDDRTLIQPAGFGLGGGTAINSCGWVRGDSHDFDDWAGLVGDARWSYDGQLPFFREVEHVWGVYYANETSQHGFDGPSYVASVSSTGRQYPLRQPLLDAWNEAGSPTALDGNDGNPIGAAELQENRRDGLRQLAANIYPLTGATVVTSALVEKVLFDCSKKPHVAIGVQLANGTVFKASKEIILSTGAYRTPQVLMLSGIGSQSDLNKFGIPTVVNLPDVGKNLADHPMIVQYWKLKPDVAAQGVALGSNNSLFNEAQFSTGTPADWIVSSSVPTDGLKAAIEADTGSTPTPDDPLLNARTFLESLVVYAGASASDPAIPLDGTHIVATLIGLMPSSKGTVTISSTDIHDPPVIDPNYLATAVDKFVHRQGVRGLIKLMLGTETGKTLIDSNTPPDGFPALSLNSTDEELDAFIRHVSINTYHPMGTAAMGKVVDTNLKVQGIANLRVVDASVFPSVIAAHIQQAVYALAVQAAQIIASQL